MIQYANNNFPVNNSPPIINKLLDLVKNTETDTVRDIHKRIFSNPLDIIQFVNDKIPTKWKPTCVMIHSLYNTGALLNEKQIQKIFEEKIKTPINIFLTVPKEPGDFTLSEVVVENLKEKIQEVYLEIDRDMPKKFKLVRTSDKKEISLQNQSEFFLKEEDTITLVDLTENVNQEKKPINIFLNLPKETGDFALSEVVVKNLEEKIREIYQEIERDMPKKFKLVRTSDEKEISLENHSEFFLNENDTITLVDSTEDTN